LDLFESDRLLERLPEKMAYLEERFRDILRLEHVGEVRKMGMVAGIELVRDRDTREPYPWEERVGVRVCLEARKQGIFLRPLGNVMVLFPPLSISLEELKILMDGIETSIRIVTDRTA
ncbi:aminotransferase class III-fold pyridoxal phosphate-dependent enzyme, partial [bacterium]|nr:aminotransferase class III-fold pyridoxal phosphate-dependent enzyme [bacterium]